MSRTSKLTRAILALMFVFAVTPLRAEDDDERFEQKFSKDLRYSGGRVTIDHRFGDLVVRTHGGSTVSVRATIRSSDEDLGRQIRIVTSEEGGVSVKTVFPNIISRRGHLSYSVDMTVTIPHNAPLLAKNQFGGTDVNGLAANSAIENKQGAIEFANARSGTHTLNNAFGAIEIEDVGGDLTVTNANGAITVKNVRGRLTATNRFGAVTVADVRQDVTVNNANGAVSALDILGTLKVTNSFGNVKASTVRSVDITAANGKVELSNVNGSATVKNSFGSVIAQTVHGNFTVDSENSKVDGEDIGGNAKVETAFGGVTLTNVRGLVDVTTANGNIKVTDIGGALAAETRFGAVRADRIRGSVDVVGSNGAITLSEINGDVKIRNSFGAAFVDGVTGGVDIQNSNGSISVQGLRSSGCRPISLRTSFSSIKVALPAAIGYSVTARTSFGRVHSQLPITTTTVGDEALVGTIGRGGCKLDLYNSNGSITIEKE